MVWIMAKLGVCGINYCGTGEIQWSATSTTTGEPRAGCSNRPSSASLPSLSTFFRGVAEAALYCAHRTSTVSPCAFCEQEGHLAAPSPPFQACSFFSPSGWRRPGSPAACSGVPTPGGVRSRLGWSTTGPAWILREDGERNALNPLFLPPPNL